MDEGRQKQMIKDAGLFLLVVWPYFLNDFYLIPLTRTPHLGLLWALDVVFYCLIPSFTLYILYRRKVWRPGMIGMDSFPSLDGFALAVILAFVLDAVMTNFLEPWLFYVGCCQSCSGYPFPSDGALKWLTIFYAAITAGFLEEIIFRGLLLRLLFKYIRRVWVAVIVSCAVFASIHWCLGSGKLVSTFLIGLVDCFIYLRRKRLSDAIVFHALYDVLAFI